MIKPRQSPFARVIIISILWSICVELFLIVYRDLIRFRTIGFDYTWTFYSVWLMFFALFVFVIIGKLQFSRKFFLVLTFTSCPLLGIVQYFTNPYIDFVPKQYYAISHDGELLYDNSVHKVYAVNDTEISELQDWLYERDIFYSGSKYTFWRTSTALGYVPAGKISDRRIKTIEDYLTAYLTTGLFVILECALIGLILNFPIILVFIFIFRMLSGRSFFDNQKWNQ